MNTGELIADLTNYLGPGVDVDATGLKRWLNDSYMYIVDEIVKVNPDYFTKASTADTHANQQEYDLPLDFERAMMVNITLNGTARRAKPLAHASVGDMSYDATYSASTTSEGDPYYYILKDNIGFLPIPTTTGDENIKIWYVYTPEELDADTDTPEIPKKYHHLLKIGAKSSYLGRDGEDITGIQLWNHFEERVEKMIETMFENEIDGTRKIEAVY
jgi:hypothetical protein